ncbi:hypothetical protein BMS3Abin11_00166 [bacterium BMS3Abin11]|nr:hypothetical protein BMS3Abin11_00166 [bacterium BMS3Abin11]
MILQIKNALMVRSRRLVFIGVNTYTNVEGVCNEEYIT